MKTRDSQSLANTPVVVDRISRHHHRAAALERICSEGAQSSSSMLILLALLTAPLAAQEPEYDAVDLARFAITLQQASTMHVEEPVPDGWVLQGDLLVPANGYEANYLPGSTWPDGIVPYSIDTNMTPNNIFYTLVAMAEWESVANIDFLPWSGNPLTDPNFVHVRNSDNDASPSCSSAVGMSGGIQVINLTTSCMSSMANYKVHHELGHALGFYHEQSRSDRDDFVTINESNVADSDISTPENETLSNFEIQAIANAYGPYDFDSVMHYGQYTFSICNPGDVVAGTCPTAVTTIDVDLPWTIDWQNAIGQRTHLSEWDKRVMSYLYAEDDWRFYDSDAPLPAPLSPGLGTFETPWNSLFSALGVIAATPVGGTLFFLSPGTHSLSVQITKTITIEAPVGGVVFN